jgi:DNA-binding PadR family transcriptional regulator
MAHKLAHSSRTRTNATRQHALLKRGLAAGPNKKVLWRDVLDSTYSQAGVAAYQRALKRLEKLDLVIVRRPDGLHAQSYELTRGGREHARKLARGATAEEPTAKTPDQVAGLRRQFTLLRQAAAGDRDLLWRLEKALRNRFPNELANDEFDPVTASDEDVLLEAARRWFLLGQAEVYFKAFRQLPFELLPMREENATDNG